MLRTPTPRTMHSNARAMDVMRMQCRHKFTTLLAWVNGLIILLSLLLSCIISIVSIVWWGRRRQRRRSRLFLCNYVQSGVEAVQCWPSAAATAVNNRKARLTMCGHILFIFIATFFFGLCSETVLLMTETAFEVCATTDAQKTCVFRAMILFSWIVRKSEDKKK